MSVQRRDVPRQTEKAFMAQVVEAAKLFGWLAWHPFLSKWSARGFPDIVLVRPPRVVFAELKSEKGKLTPDQERWLDLLGACPGVERYAWWPRDLDDVVAVLR